MNKKTISILLIILFVVVVGITFYNYLNNLRDEAVSETGYEPKLSAQHQVCQSKLSEGEIAVQEQYGTLFATIDGLDQYVSDAIQGRYDTAPGSGQIDTKLFINAVAEAYPDVEGITQIAQDIVLYIQAWRSEFHNCQVKLLDMLRAYEGWLAKGLIRHKIIQWMGFPSNHLVVRIGNQTYYGPEALEKMHQILTTQQTKEEYESGTFKPVLP